MGNVTEDDVYMANLSISRLHSVIICEKELGVCIIGLFIKVFFN